MSSSLYRLGRLMATLRWKAVGAWIALLVVVGGLAVGLGGTFTSDIEIPGTEGQRGIDALANRFPEMGGTSGQVVLVAADGTTVDQHEDEIDELMERIAEVDGVEVATSPFDDVSPGTRTDDDGAIIAQFQMTGQTGTFPESSVEEITELVDEASTPGLEAHLGGQVLQSAEVPFGAGEVFGIIAA
ncbi:MAG TPA: MMPL family transporter, partial [Candidatus Brachybacterium intestinipullorum]|nr:MMPL family transporter [Candidatus Brachybacterium intestinipullorum]